MINTTKPSEKLLQYFRFCKVKPYLVGDVLDFGGNNGELGSYVRGNYTVVNYDHSVIENQTFDTIVCLAVIEHIEISEVYKLFKKFQTILRPGGRIFLTTPTKLARPILEDIAFFRLLDRKNLTEHKHYWSKNEIEDLAYVSGLYIKKYTKFQGGFNQLALLEHKQKKA